MAALRLPPTRFGGFADNIGFHLRRAHEAAQRRMAADIADLGLEPTLAEALAIIGENPGTLPSLVAEALGRDRSSITATLHTLDRLGLIRRERTGRDRRAFLLSLTHEGETLYHRFKHIAAANSALLDRIVGPDKPALLGHLRRITQALVDEDYDDEPSPDL